MLISLPPHGDREFRTFGSAVWILRMHPCVCGAGSDQCIRIHVRFDASLRVRGGRICSGSRYLIHGASPRVRGRPACRSAWRTRNGGSSRPSGSRRRGRSPVRGVVRSSARRDPSRSGTIAGSTGWSPRRQLGSVRTASAIPRASRRRSGNAGRDPAGAPPPHRASRL